MVRFGSVIWITKVKNKSHVTFTAASRTKVTKLRNFSYMDINTKNV